MEVTMKEDSRIIVVENVQFQESTALEALCLFILSGDISYCSFEVSLTLSYGFS